MSSEKNPTLPKEHPIGQEVKPRHNSPSPPPLPQIFVPTSKLEDEQIQEANRRMIKQAQFMEEQGESHDQEYTELLLHLASRRKPAETVSFHTPFFSDL